MKEFSTETRQGLRVIWTKHAMQRCAERFGVRDTLTTPYDKIAFRAMKLSNGEAFKVREHGIRFVCIRVETGAIIVTVTPKSQKRYRHTCSEEMHLKSRPLP
jgi:hypothetical protein